MNAPAPKISFVSLGCPKALVDSERILTHLRAEGYELARKHDGADVVICAARARGEVPTLQGAWLRPGMTVVSIGSTPPEQREVFVRHELEGQSFKEIAGQTGVPLNTLLSRKRYAVLFLREKAGRAVGRESPAFARLPTAQIQTR